MTSPTTTDANVIEPDAAVSTDLNEKDKLAKRFKPTNLKQNIQPSKQKPDSSTGIVIKPLQAEDIKEHRLWAIASFILCFFLIAPIVAFYQSRRIRKMKSDQELTRAKLWSARVSNILIFSNIIGAVVWVAIIFVVAVLCIMGSFY